MCGICAFIYFGTGTHTIIEDINFEEVWQQLKRRGPDKRKQATVAFESYGNRVQISFGACVLHQRGTSPVWQPIEDDQGNVLLWNGEIFETEQQIQLEPDSDSKVLADMLFKCTGVNDVPLTLSSLRIHGPYAFILYLASSRSLWFGRDELGRRSLLWNSDESTFRLSSVASINGEWKEVPTDGLFCLLLDDKSPKLELYSWLSSPSGSKLEVHNGSLGNLAISTKHGLLSSSICTSLNRNLPTNEITVKYEEIAKGSNLSNKQFLTKLMKIPILTVFSTEFEEVLSNSVKRRVENQLSLCKHCYKGDSYHLQIKQCPHASVGVLFSGGLDSIVIACLADRHLRTNQHIDLINVAFASNSSLQRNTSHARDLKAFETPDRRTGKDGVETLRKVCPGRIWNFVKVNVTEDELVCHRKDTISQLLKPSCTVLDDSIGCALWFGARGTGIFYTNDFPESYTSPARILLVGMGADEQLGGYTRHRAVFNQSGWSGLVDELAKELDRISSRNLGRDDRIITDHGIEARYPFLDEKVVSFLNDIPVHFKMNLNFPRGVGDKLLLRIVALRLGLLSAATLPKRAIQFGSRIAKIENSKEKGSDICQRLMDSVIK